MTLRTSLLSAIPYAIRGDCRGNRRGDESSQSAQELAVVPVDGRRPRARHRQSPVLKRSFYRILGVEPAADQARIDAAYAQMSAKLDADDDLRGAAQAGSEKQLLREGYRVLSDPALRAAYDTVLQAAESQAQILYFAERNTRLRVGMTSTFFTALVLVMCGTVYTQLTRKMTDINAQYQQLVAKKKDDLTRPILLDTSSPTELRCSYR